MGGRRHVVVATPDVLGPRMAGLAIRALQTARTLAQHHDVTLLTTSTSTLPDTDGVRVVVAGPELPRADVWVVQPQVLTRLPALADAPVPVVVDLYDPFHLEALEQSRDRDDRAAVVHNEAAVLNRALLRGDLFLVASERQRDFWVGALASLGRVNPLTYDSDPTLRGLVTVVPFGLDDAPPVRQGDGIPGRKPDDVVLLWGGGLYNWFDPETLLRAVDQVRGPLHLVFLSGPHPNPAVPAMATATRARQLADELDLGAHVTFHEQWVPYDGRAAFLLDADVGVSTHHEHVETAYSFRTRVLDYLWAGLPVVTTDGDVFADLVRDTGCGRVVPAEDVDALAHALRELLDEKARKACAARASGAAAQFRWSTVLAPVLAFCADPRRAPDLLDPTAQRLLGRPFEQLRGATGWRADVALAKEYLAEGGPSLLARRLGTRVAGAVRGRRV